jgi:hypothetical protein
MENIDVYIKCYYPYAKWNRRISVTGCKMIWNYLLSDTCFNELLHRKMSALEDLSQHTKQTLSELYVDVTWDKEIGMLSVSFDFYTKEGAQKSFLSAFRITFNDINHQTDTIKLGQDLEHLLFEEFNRVNIKGPKLFSNVCGLLGVIIISLFVYGLNSCNLYTIIIAFLLCLIVAASFAFIFEYCLRRYLPKETEFKTKLNIESLKQNVS